MLPRDLTSLLDSVKNKAIAAAGPAAAAAAAAAPAAAAGGAAGAGAASLQNAPFATRKLKDGTTSKKMLPQTAKHHGTEIRKRHPASRLQCVTLPSEPTRNQLQSAAPMPSKCSTTKS